MSGNFTIMSDFVFCLWFSTFCPLDCRIFFTKKRKETIIHIINIIFLRIFQFFAWHFYISISLQRGCPLILTWELRAYTNYCVQEELMTMDQKKLRLQTSMRMLKDEPVPEGYMRYRSVSSRLSCYFITAHCACSRTSPSLRDTWDTGKWLLVCLVRSSLLSAHAQGRARPWGIHEIQVSEFSSVLWDRHCSVRMLKRTSPSLRDTWDTGQWVLVCLVRSSLLSAHAQGRVRPWGIHEIQVSEFSSVLWHHNCSVRTAQGRAYKRLVDFSWGHYCAVTTRAPWRAARLIPNKKRPVGKKEKNLYKMRQTIRKTRGKIICTESRQRMGKRENKDKENTFLCTVHMLRE